MASARRTSCGQATALTTSSTASTAALRRPSLIPRCGASTWPLRSRARSPGITNGHHLVPLSWRFDIHLGGAVEQETPTNSLTAYYVIDGNALTKRAVLTAASLTRISASRDGRRVVLSSDTSLRWWPVDQPAASRELAAQQGETLGRAEFRPGSDELGVDRTGPGGQFEIWSLSGMRRVVATRVTGFVHWRIDGTGAIASPGPDSVVLVDPATGAMTPLPGGGFPVADVLMF